MKIKLLTFVTGIFLIVHLFSAGCSDSPTDPGNNMVDSGSWYETGFTPWPHDGNPLEGENFIIYSDAASMQAREQLLQICEDAFTIIVEKLEITDLSILQFPPDRNNKFHIYTYKNYNPQSWGGQAFYGGYLIYSLDHPQRSQSGYTDLAYYVPLVKHELTHAVQTLIVGANDESVYSWFAEGIAIEISNDIFYERIDTQEEFEDLISTWGEWNPISFHYSSTYPDVEGIGVSYLYPMFWLAVRYLTDPAGHGGSFRDVRDVIIDVSNGITFPAALTTRFSIAFNEYENHFFELMNDYLE